MASCNDCRANCCKCFTLRYMSLEQLKNRKDSEDAQFAVKNFIYLGKFIHNPIFPQRSETVEDPTPQYYYTCRLIGNDGKCMDYENRPPLCRNYGVMYHPDYDCLFRKEWDVENERLGLAPFQDRYGLIQKSDNETWEKEAIEEIDNFLATGIKPILKEKIWEKEHETVDMFPETAEADDQSVCVKQEEPSHLQC